MHLLRNIPPVMNDRPVTPETVVRLLRFWRRRGYDWTSWTRQRPRRLDELKGGSVYFVHRGEPCSAASSGTSSPSGRHGRTRA